MRGGDTQGGGNHKKTSQKREGKQVINRVYAVGFEGLTFSSINDGKSYIEDAEAIKNNGDEVTPYYIMDARIKHPKTLLFMAKELLDMATNKK